MFLGSFQAQSFLLQLKHTNLRTFVLLWGNKLRWAFTQEGIQLEGRISDVASSVQALAGHLLLQSWLASAWTEKLGCIAELRVLGGVKRAITAVICSLSESASMRLALLFNDSQV